MKSFHHSKFLPDLGALPVVATGTATRDQLSLPLASPARARYVLLWFTRLPPDAAGTLQAYVYTLGDSIRSTG